MSLVFLFLSLMGGQPLESTPEVAFPLVAMAQRMIPSHDEQVMRVHTAMTYIAEDPKGRYSLDFLMRKWGQDSFLMADAIVKGARAHDVDPLILVSVAWIESKFRVVAKGDHLGGAPRSCGPTQVMIVFKGRPTCDQLMDPYFAYEWTAGHIKNWPRRRDGSIDMTKYNGPKEAAQIRLYVKYLSKRLSKEFQYRSSFQVAD